MVPEIVTRGVLLAVERGFGAIARQIQQRLAQQGFVTRQILERAFELDGALRNGFVQFLGHFFDHGLHRHRLVADFQRLGEAQEFGDHVRERARLLENAFGGFADVAGCRFAANHLRVAGNRGQRILEFVRDARGHFAQRREIFLPANLLLQRGQFGQVAHQAQGAADLHVLRMRVFGTEGMGRMGAFATPSATPDLLEARAPR